MENDYPKMSVARHYLIELAESRKLADFARDHGMETSRGTPEYTLLLNIKDGVKPPTPWIISQLSKSIAPDLWTTPSPDDPTISIARKLLIDLTNKRQLAAFAKDHGIETAATGGDYVFLWQVKNGVRRPSVELIQRLKNVLETDKWFTPWLPKDPAAVEYAASTIALLYSKGEHSGCVTKNICIPLEGEYNTTIAWSSNSDHIIVSGDVAVVKRHANQWQRVVLTATVSRGKSSKSVDFILMVVPLSGVKTPYTNIVK